MTRVLQLILIALSLTIFGFSQVDERIPPRAEEIQAQTLAADFFNAYRKTQDIGLLFNQFFIRDFKTRLRDCRTVGGCGGFARDFWGEDEQLVALSASTDDHVRKYKDAINYLFLSFRSYSHAAEIAGKDPAEYEEGEKIVEEMLRIQLKENSDLLKLNTLSWPDDVAKIDSLADFNQLQTKFETLIAALRVVERKLHAELLRKKPGTSSEFRSADFRIYKEPNVEGFFGYSKKTQIYEAWPESDKVFLKIDMVREKGVLRIIAVYPPMD